jgi:hypothetical protein
MMGEASCPAAHMTGRPAAMPCPVLGHVTWTFMSGLRAGCDQAEGKDWTVSADSTIARAHQHAACARRVPAADDRTRGCGE